MNTRFYNAKILVTREDKSFEIREGELWVRGNTICYIGDGREGEAADAAGRVGEAEQALREAGRRPASRVCHLSPVPN